MLNTTNYNGGVVKVDWNYLLKPHADLDGRSCNKWCIKLWDEILFQATFYKFRTTGSVSCTRLVCLGVKWFEYVVKGICTGSNNVAQGIMIPRSGSENHP